MKRTTQSERVLVLTPHGRDAEVAAAVLSEAGITGEKCTSLSSLIFELDQGAAVVLTTEEALRTSDVAPLAAWLDDQEAWSDLPIVLLTRHGGGIERNPAAKRYLELLGNVTFVERPFHPTTLVSSVKAALRGRRRQYEARARLEALHEGERRYRALFDTIDEGFCVIEFLDGPDGPLSDYLHIEANAAYERHTGISGIVGKRLREIVLRTEADAWVKIYRQVLLTGEAVRFQRQLVETGRHLELAAFRVEPVSRRQVAVLFQDVTHRIRADAELRISEARFRAAVDAVQGILWTNNAAGEMEGDQPGWSALTGQRNEEFRGLGWSRAIHSDDVQPTLSAWNTAVANKTPFNFEHRVRRYDGQWRKFSVRAIPVTNSADEIVEWVGVHTDVTEQRDAEERLREESQTLETLNRTGEALAAELALERVLQTVTDAAVEVTTAQFGAFFFNINDDAGESYKLYTLSGVDRSAFDGMPMPRATAVFKPTFDGEAVIRSADIRTDPRYGHFGPHKGMPKGHLPVTSYLAVPVTSRSGNVIGGLFFGHPEPARFTERHERLVVGIAGQAAIAIDNARLFQALQTSNDTLEQRVAEALAERKLLADIIDGTDVFVQVADSDYNWLAINQAASAEFSRIFGVRPPRAGDNMLDVLQHRPSDQAAVKAVWARALAGEEFMLVEEFGDPDLDRRHYEMRFRPLRDAAGRSVGAYQFVSDVSDRVREQARLREAEEALRQSQKMEAMGQLTGGVAHDFNNLLTPIVGSLDMLQRKGVGGEREQRLIAGAVEAAERAKTLVQRLLAFARRQPLQTSPVDVAGLAREMAGLIASTTGPQIQVIVEAVEGLPPAKADPNQLEMAILNLAVNSRDAMPDGGILRISVTVDMVDARHPLNLGAGEYICLAVSDTGTGMDEATRARAVDPFYSTKGIGKGTGLGLSMVHGLAAQLNGSLEIESEVGVGTTIRLWLPVSDQDHEGKPVDRAPSAFPELKGTALLVDDEDVVRNITSDMLAELGYNVVQATSAEEALGLMEGGMMPDVIITDHLMPGMSGLDLAKMVRRSRPETPVLIVSGYAETKGISSDVPILTKPFRRADLAASLEALGRI